MHQCTHCQADLADNAQFCSSSGTPANENLTLSADPNEASGSEKKLEDNSEVSAVATPAAPALPTVRTRRMHPKSSISAFPQGPWLPGGGSDEEESGEEVAQAPLSQQDEAPAA